MKRYNVSGMRLYYSSLEEAKRNNPNVEISECTDKGYLSYISRIKDNLTFVGNFPHDERSVRELYKGSNSHETILVLLFRDPTDNVYYDYMRYRRHFSSDKVVRATWDVTNPQKFCSRFMSLKPLEYHATVSFKKLPKPKELKGIKPFCSVVCWEGRNGQDQTTSQLFKKDDDLWIKCPSYSIIYNPSKIVDGNRLEATYSRSMAWSVYKNFFSVAKVCTPSQMSSMCAEEHCKFHNIQEPLNMEWQRYLERVCDQAYQVVG